MSNKINLSEAERRALSLSMVDGIWDMLMGLFFLVQAFIDPIESYGVSRLTAYLPLIIYLPLGLFVFLQFKRRITTPRLGLVKTSARTNQHERRLLTIVWGMVAFTGAVFIASSLGLFERFGWTGGWLFSWGVDLLFGLFAFAVFAQLAHSLIAPRYYFYGALLGAAMPISALIDDRSVWVDSLPMMLVGLVISVGGALVLANFTRQYPLPEVEVPNG
jgi:hypothetical protein